MGTRLCSLETGEWEPRIRTIPVTGLLREEIERVDAYVQEKAQHHVWPPAAFDQALSSMTSRLSIDALWACPVTPGH